MKTKRRSRDAGTIHPQHTPTRSAPAPRAGASAYLVPLLIALIPFVGMPMRGSVLFDPIFDTTLRRLFLFCWAGMLIILVVFAWVKARRLVWRLHWLDIPIGLLGIGLIIHAFLTPYPNLAAWGPLWSQMGIVFLGSGLLLYVGIKQVLREPADIQRAVGALVLSGGLVALIGLLDYLSVRGYAASYHPQRLTSILRNPMFTGAYLAMLIPVGLGAAWATASRIWRAVFIGCAVLMSLALVLTLTRGAWVGFIGSMFLLGILALWQFRGALRTLPRRVWVAGILACAVLATAGGMHPAIRTRLRSMTNLQDATVQTRLVYMDSAWKMFRARPWTGWGLGTVPIIAPQFRAPVNVKEGGVSINQVTYLAQPHNVPLQLAAETGLLGAVPFLLAIIMAFVLGFRLRGASTWHWGMSWGLIGLVLASAISNLFSFDISATMATFWIGLGVLAAVSAREWSKPLTAPVTVFMGIVAGVLVLGILTSTGSQLLASSYTSMGTHQAFTLARAVTRKNPVAGLETNREGIQILKRAISVSIVPSYVSYRYLALAYRERMLIARTAKQPVEAARAQEAMFRYGQHALRLMDRDPDIQLFLAIEYLDANRFTEARPLLKTLLHYQPNSAQVHMLQAKLLAYDRNLPEAQREAEYAISLDPEYSRAYLWLARVQSIVVDRILLEQEKGCDPVALVTGKDQQGCEIARRSEANFAKAQELGRKFDASDRLKYTTMLFLNDKIDRAITEGRQLQGTRELQILCDRVNYFYITSGQPATGQHLIAQLQQPAPKPEPPPQSEETPPFEIPRPW